MDLSDLSTLIQQLSTKKVPDASNMCFGIVVSENKADISGNLLRGCVLTLEEHGALPENIHIKTVPSAFQLVYGANQMTLTGNYDAVITETMEQAIARSQSGPLNRGSESAVEAIKMAKF